MKLALGILLALLAHGAILAFGGIVFFGKDANAGSLQEVELVVDESVTKEDEKKDPEPTEKADEMETEAEDVPDVVEVMRNLELSAAPVGPALEAASLSAIEAALNGAGGGGDFAEALSFSSGGRIGALGMVGGLDETLESAFSLSEIDQKPRAVFQGSPLYPSEMRGKKVEGVVTIVFVVDAAGKVASPRVESASHPAFEKPALAAVKQWKFEPAVKGGERVSCKMRVPIRFRQGEGS